VERFKGATDFLLTALAPKSSAAKQEGLEVVTVPWLELGGRRLFDFDLVVLANIPDLEEGQVKSLRQFVQEGGGLLIYLGGNTQPEVLNARLGHPEVNLLPGVIEEAIGEVSDRNEGWSLEAVNPAHPVARVLGRFPPELVQEGRVQRYFHVQPAAEGTAIFRRSGSSDPLLAEKRLGRGRVLLWTTTANLEWNNLFGHSGLGPPLLHQAVTYLGQQEQERHCLVGEALVLSVPVGLDSLQAHNAVFQTNKGFRSEVQLVRRDGQTLAELARAEQPGFYEVRCDRNTPPLVAAVNVDPREGHVRSLEGEALRTSFAGLAVAVVGAEDDLARRIQEGRVGLELSWWLLLAGLVCFGLELVLAWWFTHSAKRG
jgi:hypothetical protein